MTASRALLALPLLLLPTAACSSSSLEGESEAVGTSSAKVIKGKSSTASQDEVVLIIHYDPSEPSGIGACTGTLLAPKLVLTARHCVADTDEYAACKSDGTPIAAGKVKSNHPADSLYIFTGPERPNFAGGQVHPAAQGAQILDDGGKNLCNHDIALIVLDTPITNMPIAPVRLDADVTAGEVITSVGWGVTDKTDFPDIRQQRTGVKVLAVGPVDTAKNQLPVPPNEFEVGESICSGDSGGPALAASGAVIGLVSRGGNASADPSSSDPAANCIGATNLYTKIAPFKDLLLQGYEAAEAEPWVENGEDPRLATPGTACTDGTECRSGLCLPDPSQGGATTCAQNCAETECAEGQICTTEGDAQVCRAPATETKVTTTKSGCSSAPVGASSRGGIALALAVCAVVVAGRRRRG